MKRIRVGLIGCGWFAQAVHLPILTRVRLAEVVALAEPDPDRLNAAGRHVPAAARYDNYQDLLQKAGAEAVIVCLPTSLHADACVAALRQGTHVYLEKPIATNLDEARAIVAAWKQASVVGMIGFNYRLNDLHQSAKASIQSGALGRLVSVRSVFSAAARPSPKWKCTRQGGGGALMELGSHHIDLLRFYFGQDVCSVTAEIRTIRTEDDTADIHLQLANGLHIHSSFSLNAIDKDCFEIIGEAGRLSLDRYRSLHVRTVPANGKYPLLAQCGHIMKSLSALRYLRRKLFAPWHEPSYRDALELFLHAVRGQGAVTPDLWDGYRSLEVVCAAETSAHTGRPVALAASAREL